MVSNRRIQLSAAAVIANGLLALSLLSAQPAFASGCSSNDYFVECGCPISGPINCKTVAGCTATGICENGGICGNGPWSYCTYS